VLRPTRAKANLITLTRCDDEIAEKAERVVHRLRMLGGGPPRAELGRHGGSSIAPTPQSPGDGGIAGALGHPPTSLWGGCAYYDRREMQGHAAYLRLLVEPATASPAAVALENVPRRGIGKTPCAPQPTPPPSWVCRSGELSARPEAGVPWQAAPPRDCCSSAN